MDEGRLMKLSPLPLKDAMLADFAPIGDSRGSFTRVFCADTLAPHFQKAIKHVNHSITAKAGTIRGIHYQGPPALEAKFVRCIRGAVFDVMIDLRQSSPTHLQSFALTLDSSKQGVFIPEGFAHGFQTLKDDTEFMYMTSEPYNKAAEGAIRFDDPMFNIKWPVPVTEMSDRDKVIPYLDKTFKGLDI